VGSKVIEDPRYVPAEPGGEASIEFEFSTPEGLVVFRIPFSTFATRYRTASNSRSDMIKAFVDRKFEIWPKLYKITGQLKPGDVHIVTPRDLR
jgi:hypothetical protein